MLLLRTVSTGIPVSVHLHLSHPLKDALKDLTHLKDDLRSPAQPDTAVPSLLSAAEQHPFKSCPWEVGKGMAAAWLWAQTSWSSIAVQRQEPAWQWCLGWELVPKPSLLPKLSDSHPASATMVCRWCALLQACSGIIPEPFLKSMEQSTLPLSSEALVRPIINGKTSDI